MLQFSNTLLSKLIVHRVGNKSLDEGYKFSDKTIEINPNDDLSKILINYFFKSFVEVTQAELHRRRRRP